MSLDEPPRHLRYKRTNEHPSRRSRRARCPTSPFVESSRSHQSVAKQLHQTEPNPLKSVPPAQGAASRPNRSELANSIVRRPSQHDSGCQPDPPASQRGVDTQRGVDNATLDTAPAAASCGALRRAAAAPCQRCAEASAPRGAVRVPGLRGVRSRCEEGDGVDSKRMASAVGLATREKQPRRARRQGLGTQHGHVLSTCSGRLGMSIAILGLYVMCMIVVSAHMTSYVQPYTRDKTLECTTGYENVERSSTPLSARGTVARPSS